jgi:extracellular factor (EF) 3-hydroxypalmitic acid methyl ester biosynthesis protein
VDFLDRFSPRDRDRLVGAATTIRLARGELLLRRGERGGDMYRVAEGELEVIDTRSQPVIVLDVIARGAVVGEMSFLQDGMRSADVRAPEGAICQRWDRGSLLKLFEQEPAFAAGFYRVLGMMLVERHRVTITNVVSGAMHGHGIPRGPTNDIAAADGRALAEALQTRFVELELLLRRDRTAAEREVGSALRNFEAALNEALARMSEEDGRTAGREVERQLHPYTIRSHLGELALDRGSGSIELRPLLDHISANRPAGDGPLGEILDLWFLGLPSCRGIRERTAAAANAVMDALPHVPPMRLLVVNGTTSFCATLLGQLRGRMAGEITCVDSDPDTLAAISNLPRSKDLRLRLVKEDLVAFCLDRSQMQLPEQQIVVIDGLLEYLPDRVAASALHRARQLVGPGGTLVTTSLLPSPDDVVFRYPLRWPIVRRTRPATERLFEGAGFHDMRCYEVGVAGLVVVGR